MAKRKPVALRLQWIDARGREPAAALNRDAIPGPLRLSDYLRRTNAFDSECTIETRLPSAMFASSRCRPHSGVGAGVGV
jgi:hypothetical protein